MRRKLESPEYTFKSQQISQLRTESHKDSFSNSISPRKNSNKSIEKLSDTNKNNE